VSGPTATGTAAWHGYRDVLGFAYLILRRDVATT
jgi:hypothetical protein